jgi:type IV pilus assembly protein PilE
MQYRMCWRQGSGKSPGRGFTLIELLVVVLIVAILASIGYPSYRNQVIKGNRAAAQGYMLSLASREEQYMLDRRQYKAAATNAEIGAANSGLPSVPVEVTQFYNITIVAPVAPAPPTFLITATPIAGSMQATDGWLSLDNTGAKLPAGKWK